MAGDDNKPEDKGARGGRTLDRRDVLLGLSTVTFGPDLGDVSLTEVDQSFQVNFMSVNLLGLSFLTPEELDALQTDDSFTLATLTFYTYAEGVSPLGFANVVLGDGFGGPLALDASPAGSIVVPEPAVLALFCVALAGVTRRRCRGQRTD